MIIAQKPNKSLLLTILFGLISFFTHQTVHVVSVIIAATAGTIWSYQELLDGVNNFRKTLGVIGFLLLAIYLYLNFH